MVEMGVVEVVAEGGPEMLETGEQGEGVGAARDGDQQTITALDGNLSFEEGLEGLDQAVEGGAREVVAVKGLEPLTQRI